MKLSQFKFKLPEELIALYPHSIYREFENDNGEKETFRITRRDECRLMVLHKKSQTIEMYKKDADGNPIEGEYLDFRNVLDYFDEHDTFIFNDTKVFPARLYGTKEKTDAKIEVFLLRELNEEARIDFLAGFDHIIVERVVVNHQWACMRIYAAADVFSKGMAMVSLNGFISCNPWKN